MKRSIAAAAGLVLCIGLFFASAGVRDTESDLSSMERAAARIAELDDVQSRGDQLALLARYSLVGNYDALSAHVERAHALETSLSTDLARTGSPRTRQAAQRVHESLVVREAKIDAFKTKNAMLRNAFAYLSRALNEAEHDQGAATAEQLEVAHMAIIYSAAPDPQLRARIEHASIGEMGDRLVVPYARRLVTLLDETDALLNEILGLPVESRIDALSAALRTDLREANVLLARQRTVAIFIACLMLGGLAVFAVLLGRGKRKLVAALGAIEKAKAEVVMANEMLEERIAERTRELEATRDRLVAAERLSAVGQLAASVGHEVNNPLAYVLANVDFALSEVREGKITDESTVALEEARDGALRIGGIVQGLRTFARAEETPARRIDVRDSLRTALRMTASEVKTRARLVEKLDGPIPPVMARASKLTQVFVNLLVNAAQAIPEKGAQEAQQITVAVTHRAGEVVVSVSDTGVGIPPSKRDRIFEPFFTTKPVGVGTGLGLSICNNLVKAAGGRIEIDSVVGEGTTFHVILPAAGATATAVVDPEASRMPRILEAADESPKRVLVIDDEPLIARGIMRTLKDHKVTVVSKADEALEALTAHGGEFDLVLCDLMMPDMSGMDLHERVSAVKPDVARKMIFITGGAFSPRAKQFLETVRNERLEKPLDFGRLRDLLRAA